MFKLRKEKEELSRVPEWIVEVADSIKIEIGEYAKDTSSNTEVSFFFDDPSVFMSKMKMPHKGFALTTSFMVYAFVFALSVGAGVPLGMFINSLFSFTENAGYDNVTYGAFEADEAMMNQYRSALDSGEDMTFVFDIGEAVAIMTHLFGQEATTSWYCHGRATAAIVDQSINSCGFKKDGVIFSESLSRSSMVQTGLRTTQSGDNVSYYRSSSVSEGALTATWNPSSTQTTDTKGYAELFGYDLSHFGNYYFGNYQMANEDGTVSTYSSILTNASNGETPSSFTTTADGGYQIYINLDTTGGVANYATQMLNLSGLDARPVFDYCHITYTLDSSLYPVSAHIEEQYMAKMGASATTTTSMDIVYNVGTSPDIPESSENVDYSAGGLL